MQAYKNGVLFYEDDVLLPCNTAEIVQWAKSVVSYFVKSAWAYMRRIGTTLKAAWKYILDGAKELDRIQEARRKARQIDNARKQTQQAKPTFSFSSVPVIASERQTGRQLLKGRQPRQTFNDMPTIRERLSKNTWKKAGKI